MSDRYKAYTKLKIDYPAERILRITFDRPETYNSVDAETHTQLTHIWRDIDADPDINVVLVTGAGKAFSAGGDFELIKKILDDPAARMATWKEAKDLVDGAPQAVKEGANQEEADSIKAQLEEAGASVEIK